MNFTFLWQKQYFTLSLRSFVKIEFISSRHRVIFSISAVKTKLSSDKINNNDTIIYI